MKAVILAGGFGTRLSEATNLIPKPMVEIGGKPILWHIMKTYSHYGINDFVICCGYKQYIIKEYFANYFRHNSDMTVDLSNNTTTILDNHSENWKVTMVDTGLNTQTGGRIRRVQKYLGNERFLLTYGDGVTDLNIGDTLRLTSLRAASFPLRPTNPVVNSAPCSSISIRTRSSLSRRSPTGTVTGSMRAILCVNPKCSIISLRVTPPSLSGNPSSL